RRRVADVVPIHLPATRVRPPGERIAAVPALEDARQGTRRGLGPPLCALALADLRPDEVPRRPVDERRDRVRIDLLADSIVGLLSPAALADVEVAAVRPIGQEPLDLRERPRRLPGWRRDAAG